MNRDDRARKKATIHFPRNLELDKSFLGNLYGYYHNDSNEYNVTTYGVAQNIDVPCLGKVISLDEVENGVFDDNEIISFWKDDELIFKQGKRTCKKEPYELVQNIFSRNSGILESTVMLDKRAIISGCGSVGSLVALELARAGVGHFLLIDPDTISYHNICRHQCGVQDVGRFKVNAVRDKILQINPTAIVSVQVSTIERLEKSEFDEFCNHSEVVVVGCADNREGDLYANRISHFYKIPFVSIGFWERACAGEIFFSIPDETACYNCLFGKPETYNLSNRISENRRFYTTEEDLKKVNFEPGISTDINFVTSIGLKIILDILNMKTEGYTLRLLSGLSQLTLVCNTNNPDLGGELVEIFSYPLQVTTSIKVNRDKSCSVCSRLEGTNLSTNIH
jgi:molybdopterin/thiamine biosynthesis adenylyltransferase